MSRQHNGFNKSMHTFIWWIDYPPSMEPFKYKWKTSYVTYNILQMRLWTDAKLDGFQCPNTTVYKSLNTVIWLSHELEVNLIMNVTTDTCTSWVYKWTDGYTVTIQWMHTPFDKDYILSTNIQVHAIQTVQNTYTNDLLRT